VEGVPLQWSSSNDAVLQVLPEGRAVAVSEGAVSISVVCEAATAAIALEVTPRARTSRLLFGVMLGAAVGLIGVALFLWGPLTGEPDLVLTKVPPPPPAPVAHLELVSDRTTLRVNDVAQLQSTARDSAGVALSVPVTYSLSDTLAASITADGRLTAHRPGMVAVVASAQSVTDSLVLTIADTVARGRGPGVVPGGVPGVNPPATAELLERIRAREGTLADVVTRLAQLDSAVSAAREAARLGRARADSAWSNATTGEQREAARTLADQARELERRRDELLAARRSRDTERITIEQELDSLRRRAGLRSGSTSPES
jgi:hypothetical protein